MRKILFKGKSKRDGQWVVGSYVNVGNGVHQIWVAFSKEEREMHKGMAIEGDYGYWEEIIPETLCEFTGLYDKNGKRIWENDIVKAPIYHDVGCYPYTETKIVKVQIPNIYRMSIDGNFEVIGNSIDNPELLTSERTGENDEAN